MAKLHLLVYISGHGFGHVSRSIETLTRILSQKQDWFATIVSPRAEEFSQTLDPTHTWTLIKNRVRFRKASPDVGIIQKDSLGMDLEATATEIERFRKNKVRFLEEETEKIRKEGADLILSDSGSLPFVLSRNLKIPSFFLGSFTWDFIYSHYKSEIFRSFSEELKEEYSFCDQGYILPLSCPITSIRNQKEIGLIGRKPRLTKSEARRHFGLEEGVEYYLFSFGAYGIDSSKFDWKNWNPSRSRIVIGGLSWKIPANLSLGIVHVPSCHYPDLLRACDYVLTKPGYGILSEAYYAGTPLLYTDRGDFPEYQYLVKELDSKYKASYLSQNDLYSFQWETSSQKARANSPIRDPRLERDGIEEILQYLDSILP